MENADAERDVYDELLTQAEIQGNVNKVNGESTAAQSHAPCVLVVHGAGATISTSLPTVSNAMSAAEQALLGGDEDKLYEALKAMGVKNLQPQNKGWYLKQLLADREGKEEVGLIAK